MRPRPRPGPEGSSKHGSARLYGALERLPKAVVLAAAGLLLVGVTVVDGLTPIEVSFAVFHAIPVFLAAWLVDRRAGLAFAAAAALAWFATDGMHRTAPLPLHVVAWDVATKLLFFLILSELVVALRAAMDRLREEAGTDPLTGLLNRRAFYERAEEEIARARRSGSPLVLAYLDVDDFKAVNDRFGHETGDRVLVALARALSGHVRGGDVVARLGGDEFAVLFADVDGLAAEAIAAQLESAIVGELATLAAPVAFSIGLAAWTAAHEGLDDVLRSADSGMYRAKAGRKEQSPGQKALGSPGSRPSVSVGTGDRIAD